MENNNEYDPIAHKNPGPEEKDAVEAYDKKEPKLMTTSQELLIKKILKSSKLKDSEYQQLVNIYTSRVVTVSDASIFIEYVLSLLKFRRTFLNGKHKAYKKCVFCNSRENIKRYLDLTSESKAWLCENCALNLDTSKVVPVKIDEKKEYKVELEDFDRNKELSSSQEDLICSHREE